MVASISPTGIVSINTTTVYSELTSNTIICRDLLQIPNQAFKGKAPPMHDRTELNEKIIDMKGDVDVGTRTFLSTILREELSQVVDPIFDERSVLFC
jgi:hypothetical protein